jgi:DoxX-like family
MQSHVQTRYWINPFSSSYSLEEKLFFLLRFGVLGCFVGHGAWGIIGKEGWLSFFNVFYFPESLSRTFMPLIGVMDIAIGIWSFYRPNRAVLLWAAIWTIFTAALRPSAGLGMSEFFERGGNYGLPLAFLWVTGGFIVRNGWWKTLTIADMNLKSRGFQFEHIMRICLTLLLVGHGGLALFNDHPVLIKHFTYFGIPTHGIEMRMFGGFEMALGLLVYLRPKTAGLMWFVLFYKLITEFIHPIAGQPRDIFETIERMGDYILPILLVVYYSGIRKLFLQPFFKEVS